VSSSVIVSSVIRKLGHFRFHKFDSGRRLLGALENQVSISSTSTRELQGAFCLDENAGDVLLQRTMADNEEEEEFQVACASSFQSAPMKSLAEERTSGEGLQRSSTFRSPADQPSQGYAEDEAREGYFASQNIDAAHAFLRSISQRGDCIQYTNDREGSSSGRAYETGSPAFPKKQVHEQFRTPAARENFEHADGAGSQPTIIFDSQEESHQAKLPGFLSPELPMMQKQRLSMRSSIQQGSYAKQANPSQHVGVPSQSAFNFESRSTSPFQASITSSVAEQIASLHGRFFQDSQRISSNATNLSKSIPLIYPTPAIQASSVSLRSTELDTLENEAAQNLQQCMILKQRLEIRTAILRTQLEEVDQERQRNDFELGIANRQVQEIADLRSLRNKHVYQPSNFPSNIPSSFEKGSTIPPAWPHIEDVKKNLGFHQENSQQGRSVEPHPLEAIGSKIVSARSRLVDVNTEQQRGPANVFSRQAVSSEYPQRHAAFKREEEEGGELVKQDRKVTDVTESDEGRRSVLESTAQKEDPKRQGSELTKIVEERVSAIGGAEGDFKGPESSVKKQNEAGETRQETMLSDGARHSPIASAKEKGTQQEELKHDVLSEHPQGRKYVSRSEVHSGRTEADENRDRAHMAEGRAFRTSSREQGVRGEARAGDGAGRMHENLAKGRAEVGRGHHGSRSEEKVSQ
jgi:hypothetical protein